MEEDRKIGSTKKPMRDRMPQVAAFLDDLRDAFGVEVVDAQIRAGMRGQPTFWASESGVELGTRDRRAELVVLHDAIGNVVYRTTP